MGSLLGGRAIGSPDQKAEGGEFLQLLDACGTTANVSISQFLLRHCPWFLKIAVVPSVT